MFIDDKVHLVTAALSTNDVYFFAHAAALSGESALPQQSSRQPS
ncbi:hypothetical protein J921_2124 [Acinetobacter baumannii 25493_8]|nr:hypothetical protein J460_0292 [Acinetobacter baumannii 942133]EYD36407.1 hypothetical protein J921_2124 [Acinetobacter baumannii 25493_8]EYD54313.1 hypothetical protein J916_3080 [Acinetobacter baumannii 25493_3]EYS53222.1 hypothetical protein K007_0246 [Acinetobacter baumannii 25569_1]